MSIKEVKKFGHINLQTHSTDSSDEGKGDSEGTNSEPTTYTEDEVTSLVDKRVTGAIKTAQEKWNQEHEELLQSKVEEVERLAKLSEKEKAEELENKRVKDLEDREKALTRKTLELDAVEILSEKGLPTSFKSILLGEDEKSTLENINSFEQVFKDSVQDAVDERLKGNSHNRSNGNSEDSTNSVGSRLAKQREQSKQTVDSPYFK